MPPPPRKRFGQHFLTDRHALQRIADALELQGPETVVEIGPGRGALTDLLVTRCTRLVCIEIDRDLARLITERYVSQPHVTVVCADALEVSLGALAGGPYRLVGNLPYYITTPLLFHALALPAPELAVFLLQREVADRMTAAPSTPEYGALSVNVQLQTSVEMLGRVGPGAFHPPPTVESAIVRLRPHASGAAPPLPGRREFIIACFGQRRRQLPRVLRTVTGLPADEALALVQEVGLDPLARPENVSPADFERLHAALVRHAAGGKGAGAG